MTDSVAAQVLFEKSDFFISIEEESARHIILYYEKSLVRCNYFKTYNEGEDSFVSLL